MNKLLKNYEQVFRRRQLMSSFGSCQICGPQLMAGRRRRSSRDVAPRRRSSQLTYVWTGAALRPGQSVRWFVGVWTVVRLVVEWSWNLQFVHTKRLNCSQICARVEPPGTSSMCTKKGRLLAPLYYFSFVIFEMANKLITTTAS